LFQRFMKNRTIFGSSGFSYSGPTAVLLWKSAAACQDEIGEVADTLPLLRDSRCLTALSPLCWENSAD